MSAEVMSADVLSGILENFHFLRPAWLLALPALSLLVYRLRDRLSGKNPWAAVIDPALLPHLLEHQAGASKRFQAVRKVSLPILLALLASALLVLALAGPAWQQIPMPVFSAPLHRVYVMDLSVSMNAADIKPNRLQRAKFVVQQLLDQQKEGDTGLIAFASNAFPVVPLSSDRNTVSHLLDSLATNLMPRQGQHIASGIDAALKLLQQSQAQHGDIILVTDSSPDSLAKASVESARAMGYRVHVLAAGTAQGAPIPERGSGAQQAWMKDTNGAIQLARLDAAGLKDLARRGGGRYARVDAIKSDWNLQTTMDWQADTAAQDTAGTGQLQADIWQDEGPWLLLPLMLLGALAFRRGWLLGLLLIMPMLHPQTAQAAWWKNADQQAHELLQAGDAEAAADTFTSPQWRASALYEAGQFAESAAVWKPGKTAADAYNLGNALAHAGDLENALKAYDKALQLDPDLSDAKANQQLVEELLKQQQQKKDEQSGDDKKPGDEKQDSDQDSDQNADQDSGDDGAEPGEQSQEQEADQQGEESQDGQADENPSPRDKPGNEEAPPEQAPEPDPADAQAVDKASAEPDADADADTKDAQAATDQAEADEASQAVQQWLNRIPDDPGRLLREKFKRMQQRQEQGAQDESPW
jgi:Ca-activated chloride channel family protein